MAVRDLSGLSGLQRTFFNNNPSAAFYYMFGDNMGSHNRNFADWLQRRFDPLESAYAAAAAGNPNLQRLDFYNQQGQGLEDQFNALPPQLRGINPSRFAPRMRLIG